MSPLQRFRRTLFLAGGGVGAVFSVASLVTLGTLTSRALFWSAVLGLLEGWLIIAANWAMRGWLPVLAGAWYTRVTGAFVLSAGTHFLVALLLLWLFGINLMYMGLLVGVVSSLTGEYMNFWEKSLLLREQLALDKGLRMSGKPSGAQHGPDADTAALASAQQVFTGRLPPDYAEKNQLSLRETEVAELLYARASYKDIAEQLFISMPTVKSHCSAIYRKTGVAGKNELVRQIRLAEKQPEA